MPYKHQLWTVNDHPTPVDSSSLQEEKVLEDMIVAAPEILSDQWMLVGRQVATSFGARVDLLAIAPDGSLILIELKRDKTPRDVIAQTLEYASWLSHIDADDVASIYERFSSGRSLSEDFIAKFSEPLDEDSINESHQLVVVSSKTDPHTERIVSYLSDLNVPINILTFDVYKLGETQLLSRAWFIDPAETQVSASDASREEREPWNGEFYACFGHDQTRSWSEARKYGFICAGGGSWYSGTLSQLDEGSRVWVKAPKYGFVGVGVVTGPRQSLVDYTINGESAIDLLTEGHYHREYKDDEERSEYFVPIRWLDSVTLENAINEVGFFGNQNTVCRPRTAKWRNTVEKLKVRFPNFNAETESVG